MMTMMNNYFKPNTDCYLMSMMCVLNTCLFSIILCFPSYFFKTFSSTKMLSLWLVSDFKCLHSDFYNTVYFGRCTNRLSQTISILINLLIIQRKDQKYDKQLYPNKLQLGEAMQTEIKLSESQRNLTNFTILCFLN